MPFRIQRVPQGLLNLLSISGGATPIELEDRVRASLELLQFYALQQRQVLVMNNAALAEGGTVGPAVQNQWAVLFAAHATAVKTATMTALRLDLQLTRGGGVNSMTYASGEGGPFGATESGPVSIPFVAPYPIILTPPWQIFTALRILGTDANANVTCVAEVGFLQ